MSYFGQNTEAHLLSGYFAANALGETYLYYRDLDKGSPRNLEREALLVKYWSAAAIPMRHFDENLSSICEHKSQYWVDPTNYQNEDIKNWGLGLTM